MKDSNTNKVQDQIDQLLQKEKYLEVINSFATILFDARSIDEIVWSVAEHAIAKLNYYDCIIYLYDEKQKVLIQRAAYGPKRDEGHLVHEPIKIKPGNGIVGTVFNTGIGELVNDTSKDERYLVDDARRYSELTIPLSYKGKIIGILDSEHPEKDFFNEQDFRMLTTVAAMVSSKIQQATADEEVKKYQFNLEKLVSKKTKELKKSNTDLLLKNNQTELLLKEIHHRVKNNMQIIISLLNIQSNSTDSESERKNLNECKDRIRSMALIHERLYMESDITNITFDEYLSELINSLRVSHQTEAEVNIELEIAKILLPIDTAIPLGLIMNELITNSLKHAFNGRESGQIAVNANINENALKLIYSDDGVGFEDDNKGSSSFGLELIEILISQINGEMNHSNIKGSEYQINIPL